MRFYSALKGQFFLIKPLKPAPQPPTMPLMATSATKRDPLWLVILLAICGWLRAPLCKVTKIIGPAILPKIAVLSFLFWILVEVLATGYVEKMIG